MTTSLKIRVQQPYADGRMATAAVAKVRRVADANGEMAKDWWQAEKPIGIVGKNPGESGYVTFELPGGGSYDVSITLPRGSDLTREFVVPEGEVLKATIEMQVSPHEHLSWQQYAGIVESLPDDLSAMTSIGLEAVSRAVKGHDVSNSAEVLEKINTPYLRELMESALTRMEKLRKHVPRDAPEVLAVEVRPGKEEWDWVMPDSPDRTFADIPGTTLDWSMQEDPDYVAWVPEMPDASDRFRLAKDLTKSGGDVKLRRKFPRWVVFRNAKEAHLASIPWSWWGEKRGKNEKIKIVHQRLSPGAVDKNSPGQLTLSVQDERWFGLLEFLGSGRLNQAGGLIDEVLSKDGPEKALFDKYQRPLVAVAGGIILIARSESNKTQPWDSWLGNLAKDFPGIPDGPILLGCRRVSQARSLEQLEAAFRHIQAGVARGMPFFSACIPMMNSALAQIGSDIREADELRHFVARASARVDPGQPFTVIRLFQASPSSSSSSSPSSK